jgi:hypothetical protein
VAGNRYLLKPYTQSYTLENHHTLGEFRRWTY